MKKNLVRCFLAVCFFGAFFITGVFANSDSPKPSHCIGKKLTFIYSPENIVSEDGFTILYDGKNKGIFKKLFREAIAKQMKTGCF